MRFICPTALAALLATATAAPVAFFAKHHQHHRRQDWAAVDWSKVNYDLSGVDWNTVSYDLSNVNWATVFPNAAATPTAAAASPAETNQPASNAAVTTPVAVQATPTATISAGNVQLAQKASTSGTNSKRGLGWDRSAPASSASILGGVVSWYFNWSPSPSADMPSNWEFYANIWGSGGIENLASTLTGSPKLIGFNEPDSATQSNIGVSEAISLYQQYLVPLKSSGTISELGSPAVTNSQAAGQGLSYLSSFVNGCTNCNLDFVVVHWYDESLDNFKSFVTQAHQQTGLPVNVAEFAYTTFNAASEPNADEVMAFMTAAIEWLDAQSFVSAYAWFGSMYVSESAYPGLGSANSLIDQGLDARTALGNAYCE